MARVMLPLAAVLAGLLTAPVAGAGALERDMDESLKTRPVMKVVRMLQDMQVELNKEMEDDKAVFEMLSCWCETNEKEKTKAIELGEAKQADLEAELGEAAAKMKELKEKIATATDDYNKSWEALKEANSMRMKDTKEFHGEEVDLIQAIKACKDAITVLSKHHPELAQLREAAQLLQRGKVSQMVMSSGALTAERAEVLRAFLKRVPTADSLLAIPGFQSYAPQSGQIFGILKQMKETFEQDLAALQGNEANALANYKNMKAAKEDEMATLKKQIAMFEEQLADIMEKHAAAAKELEDTLDQLALDREFLENLRKKCAETDAEYEERMKNRLAEIAAVEDTIKYLNSDEAFANFDKTVNTAFLQTSATDQAEQAVRQRVEGVLQRAAEGGNTPALALLAVSVRLDAFTKVIAEIDRLLEELGKQQKDEVAHRDWCIDELNANKAAENAGYDKKASLEAKIEDLKKTISTLTETIESHKATIAETQEQMKRAGDTREAENADYQQTVVDQRLTQAILQKALDRMKQVYAFLEQPGAAHTQTSGNATDPGNGPARFKEYEQHAGGSRVVAMIEEIIADSVTGENEAIASEQDAQTTYESFMKDSNESIIKLTQAIMDMTEERAKAKESLVMAEADFKATMEELEQLAATLADLHGSCDYLLKNFDARQAARAAEIDALREAKAILSGMK